MKKDFVTFDSNKLEIIIQFDNKSDLKITRDNLAVSYFSRGKGGQNVNRSMNGVRLIYQIPAEHIRTAQKTRQLITSCIDQRSKEQNMQSAFRQLAGRLQSYFYVPPIRKKTKISKASKEKRLESKRHQSFKKQSRKSVDF